MTTPDYYRVRVVAKDRTGKYDFMELECKHLIYALIKESGYEGEEAFNYGNVIKYIFRMNRKGYADEDVEKAINYLNEMLPPTMKFVQIEPKRLDNES